MACLKGNQGSLVHSPLYLSKTCIKGLFCFMKAIKLGADGWADLMWHMSLVALKEWQ